MEFLATKFMAATTRILLPVPANLLIKTRSSESAIKEALSTAGYPSA